jgi:choline dehydrogenase-like flavoprotein
MQFSEHLRRSGAFGTGRAVMGLRSTSSGFHLGGTLPMRRRPQSSLETDRLGRPPAWRRIHVVDSSVFPSIPATTIALPAMANATRIVAETYRPTPTKGR